MKTLLATLIAAAVAAGLAGQADAATYKKKHTYTAKPYPKPQRRDEDDSIGGYYEHRLDAVRFGSQRWWKIYDEQKGRRG